MSGRELNQKAYERLKPTLARDYPLGRFVAIYRGQIVADADSFSAIADSLRRLGLNPRAALIAQAGISFPKKVTIFV